MGRVSGRQCKSMPRCPGWGDGGEQLPADGLVLSPQDNQTDSGMVLASEEFEQLESRYRQESGLG